MVGNWPCESDLKRLPSDWHVVWLCVSALAAVGTTTSARANKIAGCFTGAHLQEPGCGPIGIARRRSSSPNHARHTFVRDPTQGPSSPELPCPLNLSFTANLTKAEEVDGKLYLAGVAPDTSTDKQRECMSTSALADMARTAVGIPLTNSHQSELENAIGTVVEAKVEATSSPSRPRSTLTTLPRCASSRRSKRASRRHLLRRRQDHVGPPLAREGHAAHHHRVVLDHIMLTANLANGNSFALALAKTLNDHDTEDARKIDTSNGDHDMEIDLTKAGAKFSAESKAKFKQMHDAGNDDTKAQVRALLGDDADDVLGAKQDDSDPISVAKRAAEKAAADKLAKDAADKLAKDAADKIAADAASATKTDLTKEDVAKLVATELGKALSELVAKAKGSSDTAPSNTDLSKLTKTELWEHYVKETFAK
jgi:hypothetical protein